MKIKLALTFLVVAVLMVWGIFYFKNYYSYDSVRQSTQLEKKNTEVGLKEILNDSRGELFDYLDKPIILREKIISSSEQNSVKVIMHFWASWCDPCINEIPELIKYSKALQKLEERKSLKTSEGIPEPANKTKLVVVNLDYTIEDIQKFLKSFPELNKPPFVQVWDRKNYLSKAFKIDKLPMTLIWENFQWADAKFATNDSTAIESAASDSVGTKATITEEKPRRINGIADWAGM